MKLSNLELEQIAQGTLAHYNERAADFWAGTCDHDVRQNMAALLDHIEAAAPFKILDFGCGPGRDLVAFTALGHAAIGIDGSERFAQMAREHCGCEVWRQDFLKLELPPQHFDAVFVFSDRVCHTGRLAGVRARAGSLYAVGHLRDRDQRRSRHLADGT